MLKEAGIDVVPNPYGRRLTQDEIITQLEGVEGLIAGLEPLNREVLTSASTLKAIARVGIGMNNVDLEAAQELVIKVSNTPEGPTEAVAEMTLAALLNLSRGLLPANHALHTGEWRKAVGFGLRDTKVLLIGYGRIGRRVGRLLAGLGAHILVNDPYLDPDFLEDDVQTVPLEEGLSQAEVISLHANDVETILGPREFAQMQDGALLLNSARGEQVDEDALIAALDSGKVAGVWFDAFWQEPYTGPLTDYDQALLTPHLSTYTRQCRLSMETKAVRNLLRDLSL
jgi:D-3-phosphoglycerate dehydrogenase